MKLLVVPRTLGALLATATLVAGLASPGAGLAPPDPGQSLRPGAGLCGTLSEIVLPSGRIACTHGPDPAPEGVDFTKPWEPGQQRAGLILPEPEPGEPKTAGAGAPGPPRVRCYGDGQSGNRVLAMYARASDKPDRYGQVVDSIRRWAAEMDTVFAASAARTGGTRRVRFVTDAACNLVVDNVVVSPAGDDNLEATMSELAARGYDQSNRKYLVWMDATELCGIAAYYVDDRPGAENFNNGSAGAPGVVARIDSGCWGYASQGESVEAHELMHSLGSVMPSAPHSSAAGHCDDDSDRMCYEDGTILSLRSVCPAGDEAIFDCGNDDYFHTTPPGGHYLAQNWNTARSSFLADNEGTPKITVGDIRVLERDSGTVDANFTVSLDNPSSSSVSARWTTANGTAGSGDYVPGSGIVSFPAGQTRQTIVARVNGDTDDEIDETFLVRLSDPVRGVIIDGQGVGVVGDDDPKRIGYRMVAGDGGIFAYGDAPFYGSTGNIKLNRPINGMAPTPTAAGYWMVADDGGIFAYGDAAFFGSTGNLTLDRPIIGMVTTLVGGGYWLAGSGGRVFNFGDAPAVGELPAPPPSPIVGIAPTPTGGGFWLVGEDGRVYPFGDAPDHGSAAPSAPIVGIAPTSTGGGYWLADRAGRVYPFGDAPDLGSAPPLNRPVVGIAPSATGGGYWMCDNDGAIFAFGDAPHLGGMSRVNLPMRGISAVR